MIADVISWLVPDYSGWLLAYIYLSFLIAGVVKGFLGMGLPAILMVMLTIFLKPIEAIPLIALPMLLTNAFQFFSGTNRMQVVRDYRVFGFVLVAVIFIVSVNIRNFPEALLLASLGFAMIAFALNTLYGFPLRVGPAPRWQVLGGAVSGIIGGLSAVWSPPVAMYLIARDVGKDAFITITGFLFFLGCIGLMAGLGTGALITGPVAGKSLIGFVVTIAGFRIGAGLRGRIDNEMFRKCLLVAFLIMGARLMVVSFI